MEPTPRPLVRLAVLQRVVTLITPGAHLVVLKIPQWDWLQLVAVLLVFVLLAPRLGLLWRLVVFLLRQVERALVVLRGMQRDHHQTHIRAAAVVLALALLPQMPWAGRLALVLLHLLLHN
jgi:hypothetical protein